MRNQYETQNYQYWVGISRARFSYNKSTPFAVIAALSVAIPQPALAGTTTADFLNWERSSQEAFIQNSISMAGVIASQTNKEIARCMDDWYFKDDATAKARNQAILELMPDYAEFRPQAFILAYLEDACGSFNSN